MIALIVIALLTGCAYYGVFGVAFTVISADDWAGAVLNMAAGNHTQQVMEYYELHKDYEKVKEKDIPDWAKENLARYEALFNPETTNFRYQITDEDGKVLFGNYEGEAYISRAYDWEQRFIGTELERQRLSAYESGRLYDYEKDVYLPEQGYSRYSVDYWATFYGVKFPKEYADCVFDENGYLYDENDKMIARLENLTELFGTTFVSEDSTVDVDVIVVDGTNYYPIGSNQGYPPEFAYYDDYGNYFDENLNCIAHNGEDGVIVGTASTPTPRPTPNPVTESVTAPVPTPSAFAKNNTKPVIVKLSAQMTAEEYEALYDKCYEEYSIRGYLPKEMTVDDSYHDIYTMVLQYDVMKDEYLDNAIGLGVAGLVLLAVLLFLAGKRNEEGEYVAAGLGRLPWDLWIVVICCLAVGAAGVVAVAAGLTMETLQYGMGQVSIDTEMCFLLIRGCTAAAAVCAACVVGTLHSAAAYIKVKGWWRNCLCRMVLVWCWKWCVKCIKWCWRLWLKIWRGCRKLVGSVPLVWKGVVVLGAIGFVEFMFFGIHSQHGEGVFIALMWHIVRFLVCIVACLMLKRLQQGARTIADGDLNHRIDTKNLYLDFKEHAECLNRIGDGLSHSVDAQLRSERMKTELITNVSHDLKTPLTSIVNYVDLLKKEELTGTAAEYVEVLDRQSARLKKLTEDLVEASKASTGSLNVNVERVSLTELIEQARAEYAPRLRENGLQTIVRQPDEDVTVWADGKYVWRILDNLLSNVCKYAMPNTRVYLELRKEGDTAVLSVKNMSRESLNISAEELMERFVRGDSSRTTEGSGLGLSIAQSLAKLMGGEVRVTIDGDLFKADVLLPLGK